ncbi:VanZ family protein (plasmid) [Ensifer adhaerens]|uniref:VanZ family protein n=1 Tax=Ensifer adhaerens TaxID=106592 RepID=UPI0023A92913|nr:VanZ family protein [Ensifer adhaerens]WDZ79452.1 VanZ family protein [Ensifer adhaerens]
MNLKRAAGLFAWLLFAVIAYSTMSPLELRPRIGHLVHIERFGAFGLLGLLFAIAYPRHLGRVLVLVFATAIGFELLQMISADRHARAADVAVKLLGGACGVFGGWFLFRYRLPLLRLLGR